MTDVEHFHRPAAIQDALDIKREQGDTVAWLSGGTLLNSLDRPVSPTHLISLTGLGLDKVERGADAVRLGAGCTLQGLIDSEDVPEAVRAGCREVDNRSVRNAATLGGYIGGADSTRDLLPILVALDAQVELAGEQAIALLDYLAQPGALVLAVRLRAAALQRSWALARHARSAAGNSTITAAASLARDGERVLAPILVVGGVADTVIRLSAVEAALDGAALPGTDELEALIARDLHPTADIAGSAEFKRKLAGVLGARVLQDAFAGRGASR